MDARIVEFAEVLRQNGLKVALSETLDAAAAIAAVGVEDRSQFQAVLQSTLCKRSGDVPTFNRAFEFFFTGAARSFDAIDKALADRIREQGSLQGDELQMVLHQMQNLLGGMNPLTQAALQGDVAGLAGLFRGAALNLAF